MEYLSNIATAVVASIALVVSILSFKRANQTRTVDLSVEAHKHQTNLAKVRREAIGFHQSAHRSKQFNLAAAGMLKSGANEKFKIKWHADEELLNALCLEADALPHIDIGTHTDVLASYIIRSNDISAKFDEMSSHYKILLEKDAADVAARTLRAQERFDKKR